MEQERFVILLDQYSSQLGLSLTPHAKTALWLHFSTLQKWKRTHNLVSTHASDEQLVMEHYADSLVGVVALQNWQGNLLDIGSGAGFPGWVCAACHISHATYLLEPRAKRVSFLRLTAAQSGLGYIQVLEHSLQALYDDSFWLQANLDSQTPLLVMQRATFPPGELWQQLAPLQALARCQAICTWTTCQEEHNHARQAEQLGYVLQSRVAMPWNEQRVVLRYDLPA